MIRVIIFLLIVCFSASVSFAQEDANAKVDAATDDAPFKVGQPIAQDAPPSDKIAPSADIKNTGATPDQTTQNNYTTGVLLQGLNKITARTSKLAVTSEHPIKFGNLSIILHTCWKSPPEEAPESKALLEMWEEIPGEERKKIFSGWMFASSPLISAPEHPVYDITVLECTGSKVESRKVER